MSLSEKKKKARNLFDIEIDEISVVKSPASQKRFYIMKGDEEGQLINALDELMQGLDEEAISNDIDENGVTPIIKALDIIKLYKKNCPDELESAFETIGVAIRKMLPQEEVVTKEDEEDQGKSKNTDDFPSIPLPPNLELKTLKKAAPAAEEEEEEQRDEFDDDPQISLLRSIEAQLLNKKEPADDPFPSIYLPQFAKVEKSESLLLTEKVDPNIREFPQSKQAREETTEIEKEEEFDSWPSIFDASVYRSD